MTNNRIYVDVNALVLFGATKTHANIYCDVLNKTMTHYKINENLQRVSNFLGQVFIESGNLSTVRENLTYTTPQRLMNVWPSRFKTIEQAMPFVRNPQALANMVYSNRMGNINPGDGYKFLGRGLKQITGRDNYLKIGKALNIDLMAQPQLLEEPLYAALSAGEYWNMINGNRVADADIKETTTIITKLVNGGYNGLQERIKKVNTIRRYYENMDDQICKE
ncbi:MAG: putative chitinase [Campylobacterota bacterium]|nr:putative chitinase [Campylobacterota bacterium]